MRTILTILLLGLVIGVFGQEYTKSRDDRVVITSDFISGTLSNTITQKEVNEAIDASAALGITATQTIQWDSAYEWGNHSGLYKSVSEIIPMCGTGVDSTLMLTTLKFPMPYMQGMVIDTIVYMATTTASGGTVNVTPKLFYGTDISETGTAVITSPSAVTSKSTATKVSSFNNATVAKGNMIWLTFTDVTTKPRNFSVTIIGHKQ